MSNSTTPRWDARVLIARLNTYPFTHIFSISEVRMLDSDNVHIQHWISSENIQHAMGSHFNLHLTWWLGLIYMSYWSLCFVLPSFLLANYCLLAFLCIIWILTPCFLHVLQVFFLSFLKYIFKRFTCFKVTTTETEGEAREISPPLIYSLNGTMARAG